MTLPEIDQILDAMAAEHAKTGDEAQLPGAIFLNTNEYVGGHYPTECISLQKGMRYRGVRVLVSREWESHVVARVDLQRDVGDFEPLVPA